MSAQDHLNPQQFYHGTAAKLSPGDYLSPAGANSYGREEEGSRRSYVYATADRDQAENYGYARGGPDPADHHVYHVEPTGKIEEDPEDLYDSIRTKARLRVVGEV